MAATRDPIGGELDLPETGEDPVAVGQITLNGGAFKARDSTGVFDLRSGSGLSLGSHRSVDQLVHEIAETSFDEYLYTGNRCDSITTWTSPAKTTKVREVLFTYSGNTVTSIVTKQYDGAGVLIAGETMTETLAYTGNQLNSDTRVMT